MPDHDAPILFDCPRCHAVPGQRCTGTSRAVQYSHQPRQDRYIRATRRVMTREAALCGRYSMRQWPSGDRSPCRAPRTRCLHRACPYLCRTTYCPLHRHERPTP